MSPSVSCAARRETATASASSGLTDTVTGPEAPRAAFPTAMSSESGRNLEHARSSAARSASRSSLAAVSSPGDVTASWMSMPSAVHASNPAAAPGVGSSFLSVTEVTSHPR